MAAGWYTAIEKDSMEKLIELDETSMLRYFFHPTKAIIGLSYFAPTEKSNVFKLKFVNLETKEVLKEFRFSDSIFKGFSPYGELFCLASHKHIVLLETETFTTRYCYDISDYGNLHQFAWVPDSTWFILSCDKGVVSVLLGSDDFKFFPIGEIKAVNRVGSECLWFNEKHGYKTFDLVSGTEILEESLGSKLNSMGIKHITDVKTYKNYVIIHIYGVPERKFYIMDWNGEVILSRNYSVFTSGYVSEFFMDDENFVISHKKEITDDSNWMSPSYSYRYEVEVVNWHSGETISHRKSMKANGCGYWSIHGYMIMDCSGVDSASFRQKLGDKTYFITTDRTLNTIFYKLLD